MFGCKEETILRQYYWEPYFQSDNYFISFVSKKQSKKGRLILSIYKEHFETVKIQRFCYSSCFNPQIDALFYSLDI